MQRCNERGRRSRCRPSCRACERIPARSSIPSQLGGFDRHDVLVILGPDLQFGNRARILFALQFFVVRVLVVVMYGDIAAMLMGMAFQNFAVSLQLVAIEVDDFRQGDHPTRSLQPAASYQSFGHMLKLPGSVFYREISGAHPDTAVCPASGVGILRRGACRQPGCERQGPCLENRILCRYCGKRSTVRSSCRCENRRRNIKPSPIT